MSGEGAQSVLIRRAEIADAHPVKALEEASGLSPWPVDSYIAKVSDPEWVFVVADLGHELVGFSLMRLITIPKLSQRSYGKVKPKSCQPVESCQAELCNIATSNNWRRTQIATRILQHSLSLLREYSPFSVFLEVRESNRSARAFYEKNGFQVKGKRKNYYDNPADNAILMEFSRNDSKF